MEIDKLGKQMKIKINAKLYEKMREQLIFIVKLCKPTETEQDDLVWKSVDQSMDITLPENYFNPSKSEYRICIVDSAQYSNKRKTDVDMFFHEASAFDDDDCLKIINRCLLRSNDRNDKYKFVELLWFFDKKGIDKEALSCAIRRYDTRIVPYILEIFREIGRCLSISSQKSLKEIFNIFGSEYLIYMPTYLIDAIGMCNLSCDDNNDNLNIFQLIDKIIGIGTNIGVIEAWQKSGNMLFQLKAWLETECPLDDYNILIELSPMVAESVRLEMIKRYFHDIRLGHTNFDIKIVSSFKDSKNDEFIRYRYAIENFVERVPLTVPLLCDSIITLYKTKGKALIEFNGVLDIAMMNCDKKHPNIDYRILNRFIPMCGNAAVYNKKFKGFIDYQVIRKINEERLSDDSYLHECICSILDKYGERLRYPVCKYGDGSEIDASLFAKCSEKYDCYTYYTYKDTWLVLANEENICELNSFLAKSLAEKSSSQNIKINIDMVSLEVFRKYIQSCLTSFDTLCNSEILVDSSECSKETFKMRLIEKFSEIQRIRIFPQKRAIASSRFDILGIWKDVRGSLSSEQLRNNKSPEFIAAYNSYLIKQMDEVHNRTVNS